jgi:hypothetical protein
VARFYPSRLRTRCTPGERLVFDRLHELPDAWYVLHSLTYVVGQRGGIRHGEADFVLLHPRAGLLVLEVKDGAYTVAGRQWTAHRRDGSDVELDTDPFDQAANNRFQLIDWLRSQAGVRWVPAAHCVLFTDGRPSGRLGPNAPDAIVLTGASLGRIREAIGDVLAHWQLGGWSSPDDFRLALTALCPDATVDRTVDYDVDLASDDIERLTKRQIELTARQLEVMAGTSQRRRSLVLGAAGTGKTVLAQERAKVLARQGSVVGLVGQPRHLRLQMRRSMQLDGVLCGEPSDLLSDAFGVEGFAQYEGTPVWYAALDLTETCGPPLDHLIVDEAQSQEPDLLDALLHLVRPDGTTVLFADPYQRDSTGMWRPAGDYNEFWLTENCRNALPIARLVARLSGAHAPTSGADGRTPRFTASMRTGHEDVVGVVKDLLTRLSPGQVVVLTRSTGAYQPLRTALGRAGVTTTGQLRERGLLVCSVDQFRGCEAQAIVFVADGPVDADERTSDYIAASRACAYLHVIGEPGHWGGFRYLMEMTHDAL